MLGIEATKHILKLFNKDVADALDGQMVFLMVPLKWGHWPRRAPLPEVLDTGFVELEDQQVGEIRRSIPPNDYDWMMIQGYFYVSFLGDLPNGSNMCTVSS